MQKRSHRDTRVRRIVAALLIVSWTSGCAFLNGAYDTVRVHTNVPAKIYSGDRLVGSTTRGEPVAIRLRRGHEYRLEARAPGYQPTSVKLNREFSALGALDLIGAILIAVPVVTIATGHAYAVAPDVVHFELSRTVAAR